MRRLPLLTLVAAVLFHVAPTLAAASPIEHTSASTAKAPKPKASSAAKAQKKTPPPKVRHVESRDPKKRPAAEKCSKRPRVVARNRTKKH